MIAPIETRFDREPIPSFIPRPRSPAQIAASRANGARSRGPKTATGKRQSRRNSLRHGILAEKVRPVADGHHEQRRYDLLLEELVREFEPRTATQWAAVELLAHDYVKVGRIKRLQDLTLQAGVPRRPIGAGAYPLDLEAELQAAEALQQSCLAGQPLACSPLWLAPVAQRVWRLLEALLSSDDEDQQGEGDAPGHEDEDTVGEGPEPIEPQPAGRPKPQWNGDVSQDVQWAVCETRQRKQLAEQIQPQTLGVTDERAVQAVLGGQRPLTAEDRPRWQALLEHLVQSLRGELQWCRRQQERFEAESRPQQIALLERLPALELLERYEGQVRRRINQSIAWLQAVC